MSSKALSPKALGAYALVAVLIATELAVLWLMLHPSVPADYRAYYIDETTTCLDQPVPGIYTIGHVLSFFPDGSDSARNQRVCGWRPAGEFGTPSSGDTSRLRFAIPEHTGPLNLTLTLAADIEAGHPAQRVVVTINGIPAGDIALSGSEPKRVEIPVPGAAMEQQPKSITVDFDYPDAFAISPNASNIFNRAVILQSAALARP